MKYVASKYKFWLSESLTWHDDLRAACLAVHAWLVGGGDEVNKASAVCFYGVRWSEKQSQLPNKWRLYLKTSRCDANDRDYALNALLIAADRDIYTRTEYLQH